MTITTTTTIQTCTLNETLCVDKYNFNDRGERGGTGGREEEEEKGEREGEGGPEEAEEGCTNSIASSFSNNISCGKNHVPDDSVAWMSGGLFFGEGGE